MEDNLLTRLVLRPESLSQVVWAYGVGIWCGHMVWVYGVGVWCGCMMWVYGVDIQTYYNLSVGERIPVWALVYPILLSFLESSYRANPPTDIRWHRCRVCGARRIRIGRSVYVILTYMLIFRVAITVHSVLKLKMKTTLPKKILHH